MSRKKNPMRPKKINIHTVGRNADLTVGPLGVHPRHNAPWMDEINNPNKHRRENSGMRCDVCKMWTEKEGALLKAPPDENGNRLETNICEPCYRTLLSRSIVTWFDMIRRLVDQKEDNEQSSPQPPNKSNAPRFRRKGGGRGSF